MRADLEWFRTFKTVFETGTMTDAARELSVSQPGVGLHLNALETYVGYPLFERSTRKMIPNERAKLLYQEVIHALARLEELENSFRKKARGGRRTLSIGLYPSLYRQCLEPHVPGLGFNLIVHLEHADDLIPLLGNGAVDLAVIDREVALRNIVCEPLGATRHIFVAGAKTDVSSFKVLDKGDKRRVAHWMKSQLWYNTMDRTAFNHFWKLNFGSEPDFTPNYILPDKYSIIRCLAGNVGMALLPDSLCHCAIEAGELVQFWDGYAPMRSDLYLAYRKNSPLQDEIEAVKKVITAGEAMPRR